ncbi:MAG TPA: DUF2817 domain-containing protein, partial [Anaerolineae bacterium]|nr:DUF2817 domain-containing protein [Anaerolineae bacterium]
MDLSEGRLTFSFPADYPTARAQFRALAPRLQARWPAAQLEAFPLSGQADLTVDGFYAPPLETPRRLLTVTTGLHGIEGYVGATMVQLLAEEFLPRLDPCETGLLLIHALNP